MQVINTSMKPNCTVLCTFIFVILFSFTSMLVLCKLLVQPNNKNVVGDTREHIGVSFVVFLASSFTRVLS